MKATSRKTFDSAKLSAELVTRASDPNFMGGLLTLLPNPDRILRDAGEADAAKVYERLLTDGHLAVEVEKRCAPVVSLEWVVESAARGRPEDVRAAEVCGQVFKAVVTRAVVRQIMNARLFGFSVVELMWGVVDGLWLPTALTPRLHRRFGFDAETGAIRVRTRESMWRGVEAPPFKLLVTQNQPDDDNPYGDALLSRCFWPVTFKTGGLRFWITFVERYAVPHVIGYLPSGTAQEVIDALADQLEQMTQDAVAVVTAPPDAVKVQDAAANSKAADTFGALVTFFNAELSKAVLGQTLTTEVGQTGGAYAAAKVHDEVRQDLVESDTVMVAEALDRIVEWICALNFPSAERPRVRAVEEDAPAVGWAEFITKARATGAEIPARWARAKMGVPERDGDEPVLPPVASAAGPGAVPPEFSAAQRIFDLIDQRFDLKEAGGRDRRKASAQAETWNRLGALYDELLAASRALAPAVWAELTAELQDPAATDPWNPRHFAKALPTVTLQAPRRTAEGAPSASPLDQVEERLAWAMYAAALEGFVRTQAEVDDDVAFGSAATGLAVPFAEAEAAIAQRVSLTPAEYGQLEGAIRARAFTVATVLRADQIEHVQRQLQRAVSEGTTLRDFVQSSGLQGMHAETVFRNAVQTSYGLGRWKAITRVAAVRPYLQIITADDEAVRASHQVLNGQVFQQGDPQVGRVFPPFDHNCRCDTRTLSAGQVQRRGLAVHAASELSHGEGAVDGWAHHPEAAWSPDLSRFPGVLQRSIWERAHARWESQADGDSWERFMTLAGLDAAQAPEGLSWQS